MIDKGSFKEGVTLAGWAGWMAEREITLFPPIEVETLEFLAVAMLRF